MPAAATTSPVLAGAPPFRDLGGQVSGDGRIIRRGAVFRSSAFVELTPADARVLNDEIGLRTLVDLRDPEEVEDETGDPLAELRLNVHPVPLVDPLILRDAPRPTDPSESPLVARYLQFIDHGAPALLRVLELVADPARHPLVIHCTAGKDRTGVVAAILLDCLGVDADAVASEYALQRPNRVWLRDFLSRRVVQRARLAHMDPRLLDCAPDTMLRVLHRLHSRYGGSRGYLAAHGAEPGLFDRLERALLEPHDS